MRKARQNCIFQEFKKTDVQGRRAWERKCRDAKVPCVWVETMRKYANVCWEADYFSFRADELMEGRGLESRFSGIYDVVAWRGSVLDFNFFFGEISGIEPRNARLVAKAIVRILCFEVARVKRELKDIGRL